MYLLTCKIFCMFKGIFMHGAYKDKNVYAILQALF